MKIYLSGSIIGSYRAQNILKVLGDAGIAFTYTPSAFLVPAIRNKYIRKLTSLFLLTLTAPVRIVHIALATHVVVLPMSTTAITLAELAVAKLFRKRIVVDYYISQYDTVVNDRKLVTEKSVRGKLALFKDRFLLKVADTVIFLNKAEACYYQMVAGLELNKNKIRIIPLCIDYKKELFAEVKPDEPLNISNGEVFNICWWGTFIPLHGLENVIKSIAHVSSKNFHLHIFGDSDEKAKSYIALIERLGLTKMITVNNSFSFSNGKLAPFLVDNCHIAIGNFGSSEKAKTVLVNKLVDALSLGIPCLTMKTSATAELMPNDEGLIIADPIPQAIAKQIETTAFNRHQLQAIARAGRDAYLQTFSPDVFKVKLIEALKAC